MRDGVAEEDQKDGSGGVAILTIRVVRVILGMSIWECGRGSV